MPAPVLSPGMVMPLRLTQRFADAVAYAADIHADQARTNTPIPYLSHLLAAAANLLEQPGTSEDQAIAALLHDAIEDQSQRTNAEVIRARFGDDVARMVLDCSDSTGDPKPPWRDRKVAYIAHLEDVAMDSLQVSLADKLHNARSIQTDLRAIGPVIWDRFNAPIEGQRWYYESLAAVFNRRLPGRMSGEFAAVVEELFEPVDKR